MRKDTLEDLDLRKVLQIEDDCFLTTFKCPETDMLLWPMVRIPFLRLILSDLVYTQKIPNNRTAIKYNHLIGIAQAFFQNISSKKMCSPILIRASARGNYQVDGKIFNKLSDYFFDVDPNRTSVLEDLGANKIAKNRYHSRIFYQDSILIRANLLAKLTTKRYVETAVQLVKFLEARTKAELGWEMSFEQRDWYVALVAQYIARAPSLLKQYRTLLQRQQTKLIIIQEACYGNNLACLVSAARSLGIPSAEMQHGMISSGHDAYVIAPTLFKSPKYKNMLPDYFLSYGEWWNTQLRVPVEPITIGNPHGEAMRSQGLGLKSKNLITKANNKPIILILGNGIESEEYIDFAVRIAKLATEWQVYFRPHPWERVYFDNIYPDGDSGIIKIDTNQDIYSSLGSSDVVVSEISTGLFEAIGLSKRVFIWFTGKAKFYLPKPPFEICIDAADLSEKLKQTPKMSTELTINNIWEPNWKKNYLSFISDVIK